MPLAADRLSPLAAALRAIRQRWGPDAILRASDSASEMSVLSTSFPAVDDLLGMGGLPRGRLTELLGRPTSGMATLALRTIAQAQGEGDTVVDLDPQGTLDPDYAAHCGVALEDLLLIRPTWRVKPLALLGDILHSGGVGLVVIASGQALLPFTNAGRALQRVNGLLASSGCTLLALSPLAVGEDGPDFETPWQPFAAVRLHFALVHWLRQGGDLSGYETQVTVLKHRFAPAGRTAMLTIQLDTIMFRERG